MKSTVLFSILLALQSHSFAASQKLSCRNEARSLVTASMIVTATDMKLKFGEGSSGGNLENDIKNKSANLPRVRSTGDSEYRVYVGEVLGNLALSTYRTLQVSVKLSDLNKASLQKNKSEFHVTFSISDDHSKDGEGFTFSDYGMLCRIF